MHLSWENISNLELWWTTPAVVAFIVTLFAIRWAWKAFETIRAGVRAEPALYHAWGPRWKFTFWLLVTMLAFAVAWVVGMGLSIVAMSTPPPIAQANRTAANWFAWLFIFRDTMFALAEVGVWAALRSLAGYPIVPSLRRRAATA